MPRFCENCESVIRDESRECPHCGAPAEPGPDALSREGPGPRRLLDWMKGEEPRGASPAAEVQDLNRGVPAERFRERETGGDLPEASADRTGGTQEDFGEEEFPEDPPRPGFFRNLFSRSFSQEGVYGEDWDEGGPEEAEEDGEVPDHREASPDGFPGAFPPPPPPPPPPSFSAGDTRELPGPPAREDTFGYEKTIGTGRGPIDRWGQDDEGESGLETDESIYGRDGGFLRRLLVLCLVIVAVVGLGYAGTRLLGGRGGVEPPPAVDPRLEELREVAGEFFRQVPDQTTDELAGSGWIYFGGYEGDEEELSNDLAVFHFFTRFETLQVQAVSEAAITGNTGAVRLDLEGSEEARALFSDSQFRFVDDEWQFDFGFFASKIREQESPDTGREPEPADPERAIRDLLVAFNDDWIRYINEGDRRVFSYLAPGSAAYRKLSNVDVRGLSQEILALELGRFTQNGDRATIEAYEKFRKVQDGETTTVEYRWLYELRRSGGQWQITDYRSRDPAPAPAPAPEPDPAPAPALPGGFTRDGSFSGGTAGGDGTLAAVRYSAQTNRVVFDLAGDTGQPVRYGVTPVDGGIRVRFDSGSAEGAALPAVEGGLLREVRAPAPSEGGYHVDLLLVGGAAYRVFALPADGDLPARVVIDLVS